MVKEFAGVVFSADVRIIYGSVKTEFGYSLFEVIYRDQVQNGVCYLNLKQNSFLISTIARGALVEEDVPRP